MLRLLVPPPPLPRDFTVLHNDPAASQDHCGRCWIQARDLCAPEVWRATSSPNQFGSGSTTLGSIIFYNVSRNNLKNNIKLLYSHLIMITTTFIGGLPEARHMVQGPEQPQGDQLVVQPQDTRSFVPAHTHTQSVVQYVVPYWPHLMTRPCSSTRDNSPYMYVVVGTAIVKYIAPLFCKHTLLPLTLLPLTLLPLTLLPLTLLHLTLLPLTLLPLTLLPLTLLPLTLLPLTLLPLTLLSLTLLPLTLLPLTLLPITLLPRWQSTLSQISKTLEPLKTCMFFYGKEDQIPTISKLWRFRMKIKAILETSTMISMETPRDQIWNIHVRTENTGSAGTSLLCTASIDDTVCIRRQLLVKSSRDTVHLSFNPSVKLSGLKTGS